MSNLEQSPDSKPNKIPLRYRHSLPRAAIREYFRIASTQLLVDHKHLSKEIGTHTAAETILKHPVAREVMLSDGGVTYLVHGTDPTKAAEVLRGGLTLRKSSKTSDVPGLNETAKMMPAVDEPDAVKRTKHGLTYRYSIPENSAKIIIRLDAPNPGTSLRENQFEGTSLSAVDGINIIETSDPERPFVIPAEKIMGYFDLNNGDFIANPAYEYPVQDSPR